MLFSTKRAPRTAVVRVRKSPAPRALIRPLALPPPLSPPPSERCMRMTPTSAAAMRIWMTSRSVCNIGSIIRKASRSLGRLFAQGNRRLDDRHELGGREAGPADERAVDVGDPLGRA